MFLIVVPISFPLYSITKVSIAPIFTAHPLIAFAHP